MKSFLEFNDFDSIFQFFSGTRFFFQEYDAFSEAKQRVHAMSREEELVAHLLAAIFSRLCASIWIPA